MELIHSKMQIILGAVDWLSVKLTGLCITVLFIGSGILTALSAVAICTTIIYNSIRIYKEIKQKNGSNK
jgi:hypothetical protein